ncbi:hypothetical protein AXF42_Ash013042 [Apostasia shenzhenica]|uniref:Uncharacterized protein n=1 Tax=Apostasia shenzhenica TaxID=1088818 RepID=A0A2I0ARZ2_9ASPA|nr:hypothetical protein AXF42_Ash013042 [Apostasia shenzhenica]
MQDIHGAARQPLMAFRGSSMSANPFDAIPNPTSTHNLMKEASLTKTITKMKGEIPTKGLQTISQTEFPSRES